MCARGMRAVRFSFDFQLHRLMCMQIGACRAKHNWSECKTLGASNSTEFGRCVRLAEQHFVKYRRTEQTARSFGLVAGWPIGCGDLISSWMTPSWASLPSGSTIPGGTNIPSCVHWTWPRRGVADHRRCATATCRPSSAPLCGDRPIL